MKHALRALRRNKNLIIDTCAIFIKEPLLEWVKEAQHQNYEKEEKDDLRQPTGAKDKQNKIEWYPKKKIERMKDKLEGVNSAKVMMRELTDSTHFHKEYFGELKRALIGEKSSIRYKILEMKKASLEVEEQIDFLIDHATDPNILGRLWIGWSSFV